MTHDRGTFANDANNKARDTSISSAESRLIVDAVDRIFLLEPQKHPLVALLTNVGKVPDGKGWTCSSLMKSSTGNPEFTWWEDYYGGRYAKVSGTVAVGDTTVNVVGAGSSSGAIFTGGDIVKNQRTGENFYVTSITSNALTVTRSLGTTAAAAMADGDGLFIVGNVNEENAGARNVNTTRSSKQSNYTLIEIWV